MLMSKNSLRLVMNKYDIESIVVMAALLGLVGVLLNPLGLFMSNMTVMMVATGLVAVFALFAGFVWREQSYDEREALHKMATDRVAFLVGVGVLIAVIVVQGFSHGVEAWAVIALAAMVLAKAVSRIYFQMRH